MPAAVGQRGEVLAVADLVVLDADRDHHAVVMAVVGAEDLHDRVAAGVAARDPDRVHGRLGAGVRVAPLREAPAPRQLLADDDGVLGRGGEVRPLRVALADRAADRRVRVPLHHRAEAVVEVEHLVAVDVPDLRALAVREVDRPRVAQLVGRGDAGAQHLVGPLVHRERALRTLVEPLLLAFDQAADALAVQRDGARSGHGTPRRLVRFPCSVTRRRCHGGAPAVAPGARRRRPDAARASESAPQWRALRPRPPSAATRTLNVLVRAPEHRVALEASDHRRARARAADGAPRQRDGRRRVGSCERTVAFPLASWAPPALDREVAPFPAGLRSSDSGRASPAARGRGSGRALRAGGR